MKIGDINAARDAKDCATPRGRRLAAIVAVDIVDLSCLMDLNAKGHAYHRRPAGRFMIRQRIRVVKRHPEGDW
jgi:hypothetical protein